MPASHMLDQGLDEMSSVYRLGRRRYLLDVLGRQVAPALLAATRTSFAFAWKLIVLVEALSAVEDYPLVLAGGHRDSFANVPKTPPLNMAAFVAQSPSFKAADLANIDRIQGTLDRFGDRFRNRVFTPTELAKAARRADEAGTLAKRWAAKEACSKALGTGLAMGISWRDMAVTNLRSGQPVMALTGWAADRLAADSDLPAILFARGGQRPVPR